jgi:rhodanese-related sulfurtransferase
VSPTIDELLAAARARIRRYRPRELPPDAVLVDIRAGDSRARDGVVPGALHIPRTVLEWRLAPTSAWRTPHVEPRDRVVLLCDHGYSSSLAAATLVELGVDAGDVVGGFEAWVADGLETKAAGPPWDGLPGTAPAD